MDFFSAETWPGRRMLSVMLPVFNGRQNVLLELYQNLSGCETADLEESFRQRFDGRQPPEWFVASTFCGVQVAAIMGP